MDFTEYTDEELDALRIEILTEQERRRTIETAPEMAEQMAERYFTATGREDGDPWVAPTGAHNAYPLGRTVTHNGKTWENITPANVWEPGVSGWREVVSEGYPAWVAPTGEHDAYNIGDRVSFEGSNYESDIDGNPWSPTEHPAGWTDLGPV